MATPSPESLDSEVAAREAGLRYVNDDAPGIRRRLAGRGFVYLEPGGSRVDDARTLARIRSIAIPPAWTDVWICPNARGHLQATGRDARGRKQYRYHPRWREVRDETKFGRMLDFGRALPAIRERIEADLALPGLPRQKVLAAVVRLLEATLIRIGNPAYTRENGSYGLTTMRDRHVNVFGARMRFRFRAKGGKLAVVDLTDRRLATVVRRCQDLPGEELFQYADDDGEIGTVDSADVNEYLREITGQDFTAKDFRTWAGSVLAAEALAEGPGFRSEREAKARVAEAVKVVASRLGNTPAVCRACYVHPRVIESFSRRTLRKAWKAARRSPEGGGDLEPHEVALLRLLDDGREAAA